MSLIENCKALPKDVYAGYQDLSDRLSTAIAERLPERYFQPFPWETRNCFLYKALGVEIVRKLALNREGRIVREKREKDPDFHLEGFTLRGPTIRAMARYEECTRKHEITHVIDTLIGLGGLVASVRINSDLLMLTSGIWTVGNIYPVMLQRYMRGRVYGILEKAGRIKDHL